MSIINKSKIEWVDYGWNPVVGCLRGCPYCYARKTIKRVSDIYATKEVDCIGRERTKGIWRRIDDFRPTFLEHVFDKSFSKKPSSIFFTVLTDPEYWKPEWSRRIFDKIRKHPQHTFIMLTKGPEQTYSGNIEIPYNVAVGITAITDEQIRRAMKTFMNYRDHVRFLSIEPMIERIDPGLINPKLVDLVIVGGLRGEPLATNREWVDEFRYGKWRWFEFGTKYFEKNNLQKILGRKLIQELPWPISKA